MLLRFCIELAELVVRQCAPHIPSHSLFAASYTTPKRLAVLDYQRVPGGSFFLPKGYGENPLDISNVARVLLAGRPCCLLCSNPNIPQSDFPVKTSGSQLLTVRGIRD